MLFNFQLRPLSDVTPWGYPEQLYLHWFGLTDGYYWLQMNENDEFFRYNIDILTYWQENHPQKPIRPPYADYYVVRLWEDLLEIFPLILEPLHRRLARMLETEEQMSRWQRRVKHWKNLFEDKDEENEADREMWDIYVQATSWWHDRQLSTHPFIAPPRLWLWNDGQYIHAFWDNSQQYIESIPAWTAQRGRVQLTRAQFLDEVNSFHTRLFGAMEERLQEAKKTFTPGGKSRVQRQPLQLKHEGSRMIYAPLPQKGQDPVQRFWPHPDISLDLDQLEAEQHSRFQWLARSLEQTNSRGATDWDAVFDAMRKMDKLSRLASSN